MTPARRKPLSTKRRAWKLGLDKIAPRLRAGMAARRPMERPVKTMNDPFESDRLREKMEYL